jgi:MFS transporter, FSR family, fosmidomycin resistance protein
MQIVPLILVFLGHFMVDASQGILPVVLAKLKELLGLSYFQVGLMMAVLNMSSSVIQPVFGFISDKVRTGWFIPVGILWTAGAMGLMGWVPNYPLALLLVGLAGLGTAAYHPRAMMAVFLVSGDQRGLGTAIFSTGGNLGFAVGPLIGGFLVLGFGLHATLGLLPPAVLLFLVIVLYPGDFLRRESKKTGSADVGQGVAAALPWGSITAVCLIVTLRSWVYMSSITFMPLFFQSWGIALGPASRILTVFLVCGALAGLFGGYFSDRVGRKTVIGISAAAYPVFAVLMMLSGPGLWLWLLAGAAGASLLASFSVTIVLAQELMPRHLGLSSGLILGLGFGMGGLGTALSGLLADMIGLQSTFWLLAVVPLAAVGLTFLIKTPSRTVGRT